MDFSALMNNTGSGIALLVTVPFVLLALFLLVIGLRGRRKARASQNWPRTMGRVLAAYVEPRRSSNSSGSSSTSYYPVVLYEYNADGQPLQSRRISFGMEVGTGWAGPAEKKIANYAPGSMVEVYYNPENPQEAVLETSAPASKWLFLVVFIILAIVGCTLVFTFGMTDFVGDLLKQLPR